MFITNRSQICNLLVNDCCWNIGNDGRNCFILYGRFPDSIKGIVDLDDINQLGLEGFDSLVGNLLKYGHFCQIGYAYNDGCVFSRVIKEEYCGSYCEEIDYITIAEVVGESVQSSLMNLEKSLNKKSNHRLIRGGIL